MDAENSERSIKMVDKNVDLKVFFKKGELIPAIIQDKDNGEILMLAYRNKGAHSGHLQKVQSIDYDCDEDTLLVKVEQIGAACHTGNRSCFYRTLYKRDESEI